MASEWAARGYATEVSCWPACAVGTGRVSEYQRRTSVGAKSAAPAQLRLRREPVGPGSGGHVQYLDGVQELPAAEQFRIAARDQKAAVTE